MSMDIINIGGEAGVATTTAEVAAKTTKKKYFLLHNRHAMIACMHHCFPFATMTEIYYLTIESQHISQIGISQIPPFPQIEISQISPSPQIGDIWKSDEFLG